MGQLATARVRAELAEEHELRRSIGFDGLTRWIANTVKEGHHPDLRRIEPVDATTLVVFTWSGMLATVGLDLAEPCSWCHGKARAETGALREPPCAACWGTGLGPGHRGHVAAPSVTGELRALSAAR